MERPVHQGSQRLLALVQHAAAAGQQLVAVFPAPPARRPGPSCAAALLPARSPAECLPAAPAARPVLPGPAIRARSRVAASARGRRNSCAAGDASRASVPACNGSSGSGAIGKHCSPGTSSGFAAGRQQSHLRRTAENRVNQLGHGVSAGARSLSNTSSSWRGRSQAHTTSANGRPGWSWMSKVRATAPTRPAGSVTADRSTNQAPSFELRHRLGGHAQRESGLAQPAHAQHGDQRRLAQCGVKIGDFAFAAEEAGALRRQVVGHLAQGQGRRWRGLPEQFRAGTRQPTAAGSPGAPPTRGRRQPSAPARSGLPLAGPAARFGR